MTYDFSKNNYEHAEQITPLEEATIKWLVSGSTDPHDPKIVMLGGFPFKDEAEADVARKDMTLQVQKVLYYYGSIVGSAFAGEVMDSDELRANLLPESGDSLPLTGQREDAIRGLVSVSVYAGYLAGRSMASENEPASDESSIQRVEHDSELREPQLTWHQVDLPIVISADDLAARYRQGLPALAESIGVPYASEQDLEAAIQRSVQRSLEHQSREIPETVLRRSAKEKARQMIVELQQFITAQEAIIENQGEQL